MLKSSALTHVVILITAWVFSMSAQAQVFNAEGVAPVEQGAAAARELAIQDALKLIALQQGAQLESVQHSEAGQVSESGSLSSAPVPQGQVKVLSEYQKNGLYHVKIALDTSQTTQAGQAQTSRNACTAPGARMFRRKIITTYFYVDRPAEASDMPELATMLPTELTRRLGKQAMFSARDASAIAILPDMGISEPAAGEETARRIGQQEGAQFIVSGRILSTAATRKGISYSFFESNNTSQQGVYYNGPLSGLVGGAVKYEADERQFDAELWIYDGLTGALIAKERVGGIANGQVTPPAARPFASTAFWRSDYGALVDKVLNQASQRVVDVVACIPFTARVVKVENGQVYINAGLLDGLAVGDKLLLYKRQSAQAVRDLISGRELGIPEALTGDVTLTQAQPNFAIGVAQTNKQKATEGDYVRFVPRR